MGARRRAVVLGMVLAVAAFQTGCAFFACSGGGPLEYDELGDWAGIPDGPRPSIEEIQYLREKRDWPAPLFSGEHRYAGKLGGFAINIPGHPYNVPFTPVKGLEVRWKVQEWRRLVPSRRHGAYSYGAAVKQGVAPGRGLCAAESEWGCGLLVGDFIVAGDTANAYDSPTGERVAAQKTSITLGYGLGYTRYRRVLPVATDGDLGLHALIGTSLGPSDVRYDLKDGTILLFGALGWGRVNRKRYIQFLWIPIPVGGVEP